MVEDIWSTKVTTNDLRSDWSIVLRLSRQSRSGIVSNTLLEDESFDRYIPYNMGAGEVDCED